MDSDSTSQKQLIINSLGCFASMGPGVSLINHLKHHKMNTRELQPVSSSSLTVLTHHIIIIMLFDRKLPGCITLENDI